MDDIDDLLNGISAEYFREPEEKPLGHTGDIVQELRDMFPNADIIGIDENNHGQSFELF